METKKETKKSQPQYKTDGGKTKSNAIEVPSIALPKGGGAIKGIDQKFTVNAVNGTAAFSVPLPVSAARGAVPNLNLSYNSGGGNGIFGLGWDLNLPSIKRKTDKELPQYNDYIDSDTYILSEAEDLVPEYARESNGAFSVDGSGNFIIKENTSITGFVIRFYKPRIEGLFARIERWTQISTGEIKWRVITKDNVTTLYGWSAGCRLSDPANPKHVFEWFPEMVFDDKGNCAVYKYTPEDQEGFDPNKPHNRNRYKDSDITYTNLYLVKVMYGNIKPFLFDPLAYAAPDDNKFMFETALDYGQYSLSDPHDTSPSWLFRSDPFSEYKSGFEIRTTRLCRRVLLFHHFPHLVKTGDEFVEQHTYLKTGHALVKSLDFVYDNNGSEGFLFLKSITSKGYIRFEDPDINHLSYSVKSLPAMEFTYSGLAWNDEVTVKEISTENLINAPTGIKTPYQFIDLYNEGLSGILTEQANGWYYKRNLGEGNFEAAHKVSPTPSFNGLGGSLQLLDLDSDGLKQIVNFNSSPQGFFEIDDDIEWQRFRAFKNLPNINLNDPNAKLIDLNGDGKTDVLITEESVFTWWESDGRDGFKERHRSPKFMDEEEGPRLVFAESTQTIHLADMSGDGLVDLVRIRNGEVCYWPNLGYGKFGAKITMDNSPVFDSDADFDPAWIKIADIDGSGTPDIIYLGKNKFSCWLNLSGNKYSTTPFEITGFPSVHRDADITVTDLLGNGLSCIVWSSGLQKDAQAPLKYIDLMNSKKPHILIKHINNLGKEVELEYTPSTKFYVQDKLNGTPWVTKLHFPVQCLSKVITTDKVTGHKFTSIYSYHHGYFDHAEKEFRGFGRVDQTDTEISEHWGSEFDDVLEENVLEDLSLNQAPVLTRSWFHVGAYTRDKKILDQFKHEYWYNEYQRQTASAPPHPELDLPPARIVPDNQNAANDDYVTNISPLEKRQAMRSCKSMPLRTEVFTREGTTDEQYIPFSVSTHNCMIELLQPMGNNKHAVFCVKESEAITYTYERRTIRNPRIAHSLNLEMDIYGNILASAKVVYPRLIADTSLPDETETAQAKTAIIYTKNVFTNDIRTSTDYRLRLPCETKSYEVTLLPKAGTYYAISDFEDVLSEDEINYEDLTPSTTECNIRLIEHTQTLYYRDNLTTALSLGNIIATALVYESYQLAYTNNSALGASDLVTDIFGTLAGTTEMAAGNFLQVGTNWWVRSGTVQYISGAEVPSDASDRFYVPVSYTDPYGGVTTVSYGQNFLFIEETTDAVSNTSTVMKFDYRTLTPVRMKDANDNESEILLDELGLPKAMALFGKVAGPGADNLNDLTAHLDVDAGEPGEIADYFNQANTDPTNSVSLISAANELLKGATARFVYDFHCYKDSGTPAVVSTILREEHVAINSGSPIQMSFEYSGGLNNVVMKKVQAEPGFANVVTLNTTDPENVEITVTPTDSGSSLRWIGNGRTVMNNKGNVVKQYEPYFSLTAKYEDTKLLVENGVTPVMHYDALGRLIRTDFPDGTFTKTEYHGWKQVHYDQNDTCNNDTPWYVEMTGGTAEQIDAAEKSYAHVNTPKTIHFDSMGRPVTEEEKPDASTSYFTHLILDIEGNLREAWGPKAYTPAKPVMKYKYDMLGQMVYQESIDSGIRWLLHDCLGSPLRTWDQRDFEMQFTYDLLHRPLTVKVLNGDGPVPLDNIVEEYLYGDDVSVSTPKTYNLCGRLYKHWDTGGLEETAAYDFKGNVLSTERWLAEDYKAVVDWAMPSTLESTSYTITTEYDALGRIKLQTAPDSSVITPLYNERGLLVLEGVNQGSGNISHLTSIKYDAKGQRMYVEYDNGVYTEFTYDARTFRLTNLLTQTGSSVLQDLRYTYDAVGNITRKHDYVIPVEFYNNTVTDAANTYTYDALYRLIEATGRENEAAISFTETDNHDNSPHLLMHGPTDPVATQEYTQTYSYDEAGNILQLQHDAATGGYTRDYEYNDPANNRLSRTTVGENKYDYAYHPDHGFITEMPHLPVMKWNFKEELCESSRQAATLPAVPETTWYQYDSKGKRLRKITENSASSGTGTQKSQRIYIEGYEYYENFGSTYTTETLSLIDNGQRFVMIEQSTDPSISGLLTRYIHSNHQGSCTLETDENGDVITYEEYHPFGTTSYQATNSDIDSSYKRYRFTGKERDSESGLYYYGARYYVPWLCRFLSVDPKAAQFPNQSSYNYCFNNPINLIDPDGQAPTGGEDPPKGSANNPVVLPEVEVTATRTYPSAVSTGGVTPNVSNKQISGCEDCKVEGLEDGDYFSDVQDQFYTATFSNISREGFEKFKQQVQKDPGKIINNDLAEYSLVDRDGSGGVSKGDHFDIDIKGPDNGFVVVDKIVNTKNYLSITVNTLEGHPDAGTNTFSVYYDEKAKTLTWTTHNISRSNDAMSQGVGSGIVGARGLQQDQWKNVILKVSDFLGNPSVKSSWAIVKEFDYNDYTNKMGKEEKGESFTENLLPLFNRK